MEMEMEMEMEDYISNFNTRKQNYAYKSFTQRRYKYKDPAVRLALLKQIRSTAYTNYSYPKIKNNDIY